MKNKKGQNITISTIILIVLALVVLVVLILGFTGGWTNLWGRISSFFGGGSNVDSVVQACTVACTTQAKYDFCVRTREVKGEGLAADTANKIYKVRDGVVNGTCANFGVSTTYSTMGFQTCSDVSCT